MNFSIERYRDDVICDVVLMHAGYILLGRPWQYNRKVKHNGFKNRYGFVKDGRVVTFIFLTAQTSLRELIEIERWWRKKRKERQEGK